VEQAGFDVIGLLQMMYRVLEHHVTNARPLVVLVLAAAAIREQPAKQHPASPAHHLFRSDFKTEMGKYCVKQFLPDAKI
jgi:hypothetical protein